MKHPTGFSLQKRSHPTIRGGIFKHPPNHNISSYFPIVIPYNHEISPTRKDLPIPMAPRLRNCFAGHFANSCGHQTDAFLTVVCQTADSRRLIAAFGGFSLSSILEN
jgi:hypothetical protein